MDGESESHPWNLGLSASVNTSFVDNIEHEIVSVG